MSISAVFHDDDAKQIAIFEPILKKCLAPLSVVDFDSFTDTDLFRDKIQNRPHYAFIDLHLSSKGTKGGIEIAEDIRDNHPDTVIVILTREDVDVQSILDRPARWDLFLSKNSLRRDAEYAKWASGRLIEITKRTVVGNVKIPTLLLEAAQAIPSKKLSALSAEKQVKSLLEQVTFCGVEVSSDPDAGIVRMEELIVELLTPGYSGSAVALISPVLPPGVRGVPGVLKLSRRDAAAQEIVNFDKYVKWYLPYRWRVDILGQGMTSDLGAVCYSFVHGGGAKPVSVSDILKKGNEEVVDLVLNTILDSSSRDWSKRLKPTGTDMAVYFSSTRFFKRRNKSSGVRERQERWFENLKQVLKLRKLNVEKVDGLSFKVDNLEIPLPDTLLSTNSWGEIVECVSHGDLNANNIIAELGSENLALIDFYETGWWYTFRDFVSFELSLWLDMQQNESTDFCDLVRVIEYDLEVFVGAGKTKRVKPSRDDPLPRICKAVRNVRNAAHGNFPNVNEVPRVSYALGLMVQAWLLGSWVNGPWAPWQQERLAAVACAAARVAYAHRVA